MSYKYSWREHRKQFCLLQFGGNDFYQLWVQHSLATSHCSFPLHITVLLTHHHLPLPFSLNPLPACEEWAPSCYARTPHSSPGHPPAAPPRVAAILVQRLVKAAKITHKMFLLLWKILRGFGSKLAMCIQCPNMLACCGKLPIALVMMIKKIPHTGDTESLDVCR